MNPISDKTIQLFNTLGKPFMWCQQFKTWLTVDACKKRLDSANKNRSIELWDDIDYGCMDCKLNKAVSKIKSKTCPLCNKTLDANSDNFYKNPSGKYGFMSRCKKCHSEHVKRMKKIKRGEEL